jgi:HK97 family phage prohead protease
VTTLEIIRNTDLVQCDGRTIFGIVAPYGEYAEVHDHMGPSRPYQERIERGAFARTIVERGRKINLIYDHTHDTTMPIGRASHLEEQPGGLFAEFHVAQTPRGEEALQLVKEGVISGFSIRARVVRSRNDSRNHVTRQEMQLRDVSLTSSPVYATAGVYGVRSHSGDDPAILSTELAAKLLRLRMKVTP